MNKDKPWFWPDTQGFLAIAIITVMAAVIFIMLFHTTTMDDRTQGVLMTILGSPFDFFDMFSPRRTRGSSHRRDLNPHRVGHRQ